MEEKKTEKKGSELRRAIFQIIGGVVFICVICGLFVLVAYHRSEIRVENQQKFFLFAVFAILGGLVMIFSGVLDIIEEVKKRKKNKPEEETDDDKK